MKSFFTSLNPSDGSVVWEGKAATENEVVEAIQKSRRAFVDWSARSLEERIGCLKKFAMALEARKETLAELISREIGKPLWESRTEVGAMIAKVEISILAYNQRCSEFSGGKAITRFRPHGVMVVPGPYNFPGHLPNGHICPALLAGNTVIFKPSELAPATAEATLACWMEAGLPEAVLQVLQGDATTAKLLAQHPDIDGVLFTGSVGAGKSLARQFADMPGKILALEMGGNNPLIVDTAHIGDLDAAAEITLHSAFLSAGQRCTCARRLIIIESPDTDSFIERMLQKTKSLHIDEPFADPAPFMGPLASQDFPGKILNAQRELLRLGAKPLLKATILKEGTGFISPGILDVSLIPQLPDEEIFGPLLQLIRVQDLESAIARANDTRFGLAAGVLTDDEPRYRFAYPRLRAGIINWNSQLTGASSAAPFGGIKDSGNFRPSAFFAADYCSYPVASIEAPNSQRPN